MIADAIAGLINDAPAIFKPTASPNIAKVNWDYIHWAQVDRWLREHNVVATMIIDEEAGTLRLLEGPYAVHTSTD